MLRITIVAVGSLKEPYWRDAVKEYLKRLTPYVKLTIKEVKEEAFKSEKDKKRVLAVESKKIFSAIPEDAACVLLDTAAKQLTSEQFAAALHEMGGRGNHLVFIIGGPLGVSDTIRQHAALLLSFSRLTFTHQIARILLLEQLYRAVTIIHRKIYHY
ncbi:23S rRNA (pseudouridine(1915)-N(3))-methyltransferase RlmH [Candidatus Uhrbacteria bacterium]|nr:23S rRNA (pseudouridine(1915)-N(3))-methyltransferase RlmH [Candidatus Uhrbacteria bacterium]